MTAELGKTLAQLLPAVLVKEDDGTLSKDMRAGIKASRPTATQSW